MTEKASLLTSTDVTVDGFPEARPEAVRSKVPSATGKDLLCQSKIGKGHYCKQVLFKRPHYSQFVIFYSSSC